MMHHLRTLIVRVVGWAASVFYQVDEQGGPIPEGPVLVVANHPNSLLDPLMIFWAAGRATRPLAKAPLFEMPIIGSILHGLGGLPVYRRQEDPSLMGRNEETFRAAVAALRAGDAVQIFPEGRSHSEPALAPLRTGAARIALRAEEESDWALGLKIVPVGLTYTRKVFFRGRAVVALGAPLAVVGFRDDYAADPTKTVRALTDEIAVRLEALTLNLSQVEDRPLIDVAERLYSREKGWTDWRERQGLGERLPRLQQFAEGLAWLRAHDPQRHRRLAEAVRRYQAGIERLGAGEADVPPRYAPLSVLRYIGRETVLLGLGLPLAAVGAVFWYLPYLVPRLVVRLIRPDIESVATYKLGVAMLSLPLAYALWVGIALRAGGLSLAIGVAAALPALGYVALHWSGRWEKVREDARLFLRLLRQPDRKRQLAAERERLVAAFDAVRADMGRDRTAAEEVTDAPLART
jgi:1-acyl-sn-glycerol-3-phosphate acyltransferase